MIMNTLIAMTMGLVLNMMLGRPAFFSQYEKHIMSVAKKFEKKLKKSYKDSSEAQRTAGGMLVLFMLLIFSGIPLLLIILAYLTFPFIGILLEALFFWFSINIKNTRLYAYGILRTVKAGNLVGAQKRLSRFTGKDCSEMDMDTIIKTTIEKTSDRSINGGFSPIFYMMLFGGFGAMLYKTMCLLNGEIARNKDDYIDFGDGTKKIWDVLGFIPSRIAAKFLMLDVRILSLDKNNAKRIYKRDRTHATPAFLGEARAVIAGAIGIQLNKEPFYDGTLMRTRSIGQPVKNCEPNDIYWTNQLFYGSVFCFYLACALVRMLLFLIF